MGQRKQWLPPDSGFGCGWAEIRSYFFLFYQFQSDAGYWNATSKIGRILTGEIWKIRLDDAMMS